MKSFLHYIVVKNDSRIYSSFSSSSFSQLTKVAHLCPKPLLVSIFYIPYIHTPTDLISFSILSNHFFFGLPHYHFPLMFIFISTLTALVFSLLITCPNHLNLYSLILFTIDTTLILPLTYIYI
jgi:hypothetical protein